MKILIVHAHPEPRSFNAAMRDLACRTLRAGGHEVRVSDLYAEGFNPTAGRHDFETEKESSFFKYQAEQTFAQERNGFVKEVADEQAKLLWCDLVIFQFPLWWFSVPAILKGWLDRVLAMGFAYGGGRWFETGPLRPRRAMIAMTCGAPQERYTEGRIFGGIERVLYPLHVGVFNLVGLDVLEPFIAWAPSRSGAEERGRILERYAARLAGIEADRPRPMHTVAEHPDPMAGQSNFFRP